MRIAAPIKLVMAGVREPFGGDRNKSLSLVRGCCTLMATLLFFNLVFGVLFIILVTLQSGDLIWPSAITPGSSRRQLTGIRLTQTLQQPATGDVLGCDHASEECWAGVYVDSASMMTLHLDSSGRAFQSPASSRHCQLWWRAYGDTLHMVDCAGLPFRWPGAIGDLIRDPPRPGKLAGFSDTRSPSNRTLINESLLNSERLGMVSLVRDPSGFLFPGCMYVLSMRKGSACGALARANGGVVEHRLVLGEDGGLTHENSGERIATLSYVLPRHPVSEASGASWATGHEVVLRMEANHEGQESAAASLVDLSSWDGGATWQSALKTNCAMKLSLVMSSALSMLPVTDAMSPEISYLSDDNTQHIADPDAPAAAGDTLRPIMEVFQARPINPFHSDGNGLPRLRQKDWAGRGLMVLIVISRDVPRPTQRQDLSCVVNGTIRRAVWLSWGMVLCSAARVQPREATLHLAFKNQRISTSFSFLHAPLPRHTHLAWHNSQALGALPESSTTTLAICTMFKNEAPYLEEWLQYHRLLGVDKVYMYDNGSSDKSRELLKEHESSEFVEVRDWHHQAAQTEALNDCLSRFRHTSQWMTFIDIDEFIDPAPGLPIQPVVDLMRMRGSMYDVDLTEELEGGHPMAVRRKLLMDLLEGSGSSRHTHCMPWVNYCSFGQLTTPKGRILENFLQVEDMGEAKIHMQKPLFRAMEALTLRRIGPHFLLYASQDIDAQYSRNLRCPYEWLDQNSFQIRHYRSKSLEEYVDRRVGTDAAYKGKRYSREKLAAEWKETNAGCRKKI